MIIYAVGAFSIIVLSAILWIVLLSSRQLDRIVKNYIFWSAAISCWALGYGITLSGQLSYDATLFWNRTCHVFACIIPVAFMQLTLAVCKRSDQLSKYLVKLGYGIALFLIFFSYSPLFVKRLWSMGIFDYQPLGGPLYLWFTVFFMGFTTISIIILINGVVRADGISRSQILTFLLGAVVAYSGGSTLFFQAFQFNIYPFGIFFISSHVLFTGYNIYKYRFMDLEILIKRTTVFAGLFAFVYTALAGFTLLGQKLFENILGWSEWTALVPSVLLITITLRPLEEYLTKVTERYLFQKKYDYKELLRIFTTEVITYLELEKVAINTAKGLNNIIKLESVSVWIQDDSGDMMNLIAFEGMPPIEKKLSVDNAIVKWVENTHNYLLLSVIKNNPNITKALTKGFTITNSELVLPIIFRQDLIGLIAMGNKKSGDVYRPDELPLLMSIASTVGIAISNAKLFAELSAMQAEAAQKDKMAVIGTLAAGINHEICNPLGIVRGQSEMFLLNQRDGLFDNLPPEKVIAQATSIFEKVIKETDRATGITKRLSTFAKPSNMFNLEPVQVAGEIDEVLELLRTEMKVDNIIVKNTIPKDFPLLMVDKKQLQQVTFNIIRNAAQAMPESGEIIVGGSRNGTKASVSIRDTGHGISEDKLKNIFHPFFTTKDPGKGTGLGLFIVKQIVEKNHGTIACTSEVGKGTTFTLTFLIAKDNIELPGKVGSIA